MKSLEYNYSRVGGVTANRPLRRGRGGTGSPPEVLLDP